MFDEDMILGISVVIFMALRKIKKDCLETLMSYQVATMHTLRASEQSKILIWILRSAPEKVRRGAQPHRNPKLSAL